MESSEQVVSDGGDDEEQHRLRLRALLHELVRKKGRVEAARELGLDPQDCGGVHGRRGDVLAGPRGAGTGASGGSRVCCGAGAEPQRGPGTAGGVAGRLAGGCGEGTGWRSRSCRRVRWKVCGRMHTRKSGQVERQLDRVEAHRGVNGELEDRNEAEGLAVSSGEQRRYPELVTKDPAAGR